MLRRNLGKKRVEISEDQSAAILAVYEAFEETKVSKIFDTTDFGYTKVTVERPLHLRYDLSAERRRRLRLDAAVLKLKDGRADEFAAALDKLAATGSGGNNTPPLSPVLRGEGCGGEGQWRRDQKPLTPDPFSPEYRGEGGKREAMPNPIKPRGRTTPILQGADERLALEAHRRVDQGDPRRAGGARRGRRPGGDADGRPVPDSELRDFENVPLKEDVGAYFRGKSCRTSPTPGWTPARTRWATKSASPSISTSTRRCPHRGDRRGTARPG